MTHVVDLPACLVDPTGTYQLSVSPPPDEWLEPHARMPGR